MNNSKTFIAVALMAALAFAIVAASSFATPVFGKLTRTPPLVSTCHDAPTGDSRSGCAQAATPPPRD